MIALLLYITSRNSPRWAIWGYSWRLYRVVHKNVALYFCPYLRQLLTDF